MYGTEERMDATLNYGTPRAGRGPRGAVIAGVVWAAVVLVINGYLLGAAWQDRSWGALGIACMVGPMTNGVLLVVGAALTPVVWRFSGTYSMGYLALAVVGPDLHGLDPRGLILAGLASLAAAAQFFAAAHCATIATMPKLFWSHVVILPVTLAIVALTGSFQPPHAFLLAPLAVAVTYGGYLVGFVLQILALARIAPGPAGLAFCAEPIFAVVIAAVVLGERLGALQYAGGALVIAALVANVILEQTRRRPMPA